MKLIRLVINLSTQSAADLNAIAARRGITRTEALRRALLTYRFLLKEQHEGRTIRTVKRGRKARELELL